MDQAHGGRPAAISLAGALLLVALLVLLPQARSAFFLFDDYAIVGITSTTPLAVLVRTSYGFFRPAALALFRAEALLFGWTAPWGWDAVSAALHLAGALLAATLFRRSGISSRGAAAGAALFAASPWAGEALFWHGAQFDLIAFVTFAAAALLGLAALRAEAGRATVLGSLAILAAALSVLSKEMTVTLPLLFFVFAALSAGSGRRVRRTALIALALAGVVGAYLAIRSRLLPGLTGPYGRFGDIVRPDVIGASLLGHLREILLPPVFAGRIASNSIRALLALLWGVSLLRAIRNDRRRALLFASALVVSLAPVVWNVPEAGSTAGGRLRYLPGLFACGLFGLGWSRTGDEPEVPWARRLGVLAPAAAFALGLIALASQQRLWARASSLARQAVEQVGALAPLERPLFITNLPFALAEGPYVLKSYAFRHYYGERLGAKVRSTAVTYAVREDGLIAVREEPDPFSEYSADPSERRLALDLKAP